MLVGLPILVLDKKCLVMCFKVLLEERSYSGSEMKARLRNKLVHCITCRQGLEKNQLCFM